MENKTIVQQLKGYFEQQLSLHEDGEIKYTTKEALIDAVEICEKSIAVEKKQLVDFHIEVMKDGLISEGNYEWNDKDLPIFEKQTKETYLRIYK
jgi:predicted DNA-binding protein YlxM (UPF0122 family)